MSEEVRQITRQIAAYVAEALSSETGHEWRPDTSDRVAEHIGVYIDGPNGFRLWLRLDWRNPSRLEIRGVLPDGYGAVYGVPENPRITVKRDRAPVAVAREIVRRVLPGYEAALTYVTAKLSDNLKAKQVRENVAADLWEVLPMARVDRSSDRAKVSFRLPSDQGYGEVELHYGGTSGEIVLKSAPIELIRKIAAVLADAAAGR